MHCLDELRRPGIVAERGAQLANRLGQARFRNNRESILMEREFNQRAGFTRADDRLPEWMTREKLPPTNAVFDVPEDEMDGIFEQ